MGWLQQHRFYKKKRKSRGINVTASIANNELDYLVRQQLHPNPIRRLSQQLRAPLRVAQWELRDEKYLRLPAI
jgi:hypothetical protein